MIILILLLVLNSSADAETLDELVRSGYSAYSIDELEEAEQVLSTLQSKYPNSHLGELLQVLVKIREGDSNEAKRLLVEFDSKCNMNSSSCDSPSVHVIAKTIQGRLFHSESTLREADEMIGQLFSDLYGDCYETQIEIYIKNENPQKVCDSCDEYESIYEGYLNPNIALKCFIAYYSMFRNEDSERVWKSLSSNQKHKIKKLLNKSEF